MFDLGWSEFLLILMIALLALGPRELTRAAFMIGNFFGKARDAFSHIRHAFEDMAETLETEGDSLTRKIDPEQHANQKKQKTITDDEP